MLEDFDHHIVLEYSFFIAFARDICLSLTILNAVGPLSLKITAVYPIHLAEAVSYVCLVISFIYIARTPGKCSESPFFIIPVLAIISITHADTSFPASFTVPQSIFEVSFEIRSIIPVILSITWWLPIYILTFV